MQILGIGTDLVQIARVKRLLEKHGHFPYRVLSEREARGMPYVHTDQIGYLAKRIAAKEAAVKALGTGFRGIGWQDVEVVQLASGAPTITFYRTAQLRAHELGVQHALVSLSDEREYALAFVILTD